MVVDESEPTHIEGHELENEIWEGIKQIFGTEMIELTDQEKIKRQKEEQKTEDERFAEESFNANIQYKQGRYWVKPIFRKDFKPMRNNYSIALRKYKGLRARLSMDPSIEDMYCEAIHTLIANGEVEKFMKLHKK